MKEIDLINNEELRDQYIDHYEVLEKVKELLLIPGTETATMKQVAEYYKVDEGAIKMLVSRNRSELEEDGMQSLNGLETKAFLVSNNLLPTNERGYFEVDGIKFAYKSNLLFPRRAILRTGMLLQDSEIAKEVRTALL